MGLTRIAKNRAGTLAHVFEVDETPTDPTGTPTYSVADANGTVVQSGNATAAGGSTGRVSVSLAAQSQIKRGTVTWTATIAGGTVVEYDEFEIVSGFYFSLKQGRDSDSSLSDTSTYPTSDLVTKRTEVEVECEAICDRAFLPRYDRVVLDGTGTSRLTLKHSDPTRSVADVRTLRRISVAPDVDETFVDFTAGELAGVVCSADGVLTRTDGAIFTEGYSNVVVELEYGLNAPFSDLVTASLTRFRSRLNLNKSGIPDRATSYSLGEHGVYRITLPSEYQTGIPDVDAVYGRYSRRSGTGPNAKKVPASRSLTYNPQRFSMFHGRHG